MDAQAYIDEMRAKKRRNLIIGAIAAVILAIIILPGLFGKGKLGEADLEEALRMVPSLDLTQAEKDLADTILEPETFRSKLTYDALTATAFEPEEVQDIIGAVLPENARINAIGVQGAVIYIDYQAGAQRIVLEYVDPDRSGSVDQIRKAVEIQEVDLFCQISYEIRNGALKLLESRGIS